MKQADHTADLLRWNNHWSNIQTLKIQKTLRRIINDLLSGQKISHRLRSFHDILGYKAKDTAEKGGLCVGCLYQSKRFLELPFEQRSGRKIAQTVHVEHTVPIRVLETYIQLFYTKNIAESDLKLLDQSLWNQTWLYWFLFKYSVTTAMTPDEGHESPRGMVLQGLGRNSYALDKNHLYFNQPMLRYGQQTQIYCLDQKIERSHSFDDHWNLLVGRLNTIQCNHLIPTACYQLMS